MLRSTIASLGPSRFRTAEPETPPAPLLAPVPAARPEMGRLERLTVLGLGIAGVLPPLAFTARPGELGHIAAVPVSVVLTGMLILAPALVGLVAALFGLDSVRDGFRFRGDREHEQAVLRVFAAALAVGYGFCFGSAPAYGDVAASSLVVAALGLAGAWVFLALSLIDPSRSPPRYYLGLIYDAALLSAFLHFGGVLTAPWFLLYLLASFYAAFRFGATALAIASLAGLAGFGAVVATTQFWQEQVLLAGGLCVALIVLPAYVGAMAREVAASRNAAATAQAARTRFMTVISQGLRAPLDAIIGMGSEPQPPSVVPSARALLSQLNNILDFSAIETGALVPAVEAFDLHRLVNETLADRRAEAKTRGEKLRVNIDPALPHRLRGWRQQLVQIIDNLVPPVNEMSSVGAVRIGINGVVAGSSIDLRITVRDDGAPTVPGDADAVFDPVAGEAVQRALGTHGAFRLAVVKRLVELMGGAISVAGGAKGTLLTISVPLEVDEPAVDSALDLGRCLVLIATEDGQFASELAEPLNAWHGDPRWIEGFGGTLGFLDSRDGASSVLIVDARSHVLAALSFAHRAATGASPPAFIVVVAEPAQIGGFVELADGEVDAVLPAPLDAQLLASTLHSLPLSSGAPPRPVLVPAAVDEPESLAPPPAVYPAGPIAEPQVTPISAHPRFGAETPVIDPQAMAALRGLGDGDAFLGEVIGSFRADAKEVMYRMARAAKSTDAAGFTRGLQVLRGSAANLGGARLCETLLSMREVGARELREQGGMLVQRIADELARLDAALGEYLPEPDERQRG